MRTFKVSKAGRFRAIILLATLTLIFVFTGRKAFGLLTNPPVKETDLNLYGLNLNTTVPAILLSVVALSCLPVAWYLFVELLTKVEMSEGGICVSAPGYRVFYRWEEVAGIDMMVGLQEDAAASLKIITGAEPQSVPDEKAASPQETPVRADTYLSEQDRRLDRASRKLIRQQHKEELQQIQSRATHHDGRKLGFWTRLLYPQARRPDRILLYPALEDRAVILSEIRGHLQT